MDSYRKEEVQVSRSQLGKVVPDLGLRANVSTIPNRRNSVTSQPAKPQNDLRSLRLALRRTLSFSPIQPMFDVRPGIHLVLLTVSWNLESFPSQCYNTEMCKSHPDPNPKKRDQTMSLAVCCAQDAKEYPETH